ncbi:hypothetical protein F511_02855 [Dorcoceras hygrometricum]|uniref:Uncharacterized protein n=1 Tax=Dorcoceras hygrometricum TaxID=472368 RepID=A0A2Z7AQS1_9LAMI|nr:hypothetical protein F511_02855 [Dorcoceras hygrometricum]
MEKLYDHRFQRTDQWMPVYSWLESLDTDEVIKSADVADWLNANPEIRDHLYARHSRYHLMHYIKKCHVKILKRKEKQGLIVAKLPPPTRVHQNVQVKAAESPHSTVNNPSTIPNSSEMYRAKQSEASRKYDIWEATATRRECSYSYPHSAMPRMPRKCTLAHTTLSSIADPTSGRRNEGGLGDGLEDVEEMVDRQGVLNAEELS